MQHFIATFEIESSPGEPHLRFREAALARGWTDTITVAGEPAILPANTLLGEFSDIDAAQAAFEQAVTDASALMAPARLSIERRYIAQRAMPGRFKARREWVKTNIALLRRYLRPKSSG